MTEYVWALLSVARGYWHVDELTVKGLILFFVGFLYATALSFEGAINNLATENNAYGRYARPKGRFGTIIDVNHPDCPLAVKTEYLRLKRLRLFFSLLGLFLAASLSLFPQ